MNKIETVNKQICEKLNKISFGQFLNELFEDVEGEKMDKQNVGVQHDLLMKFTKEAINKKFKLNKEYNFASGTDCGRLFVKYNGIQRLHHKIRGVLCDGLYTDFDMVNAHPAILLYLCKLNNYPCYSLEIYVNQRDDKILELMDEFDKPRSFVKNLILKSMNSEKKINTYKIDKKFKNIKSTFFLGLDKDFKDIQKLFVKQYPELKKKLINKGVEDNIQGKVLNRILCEYENKILQEGIDKLYESELINNKEEMVLMFDGVMLHNENIKGDTDLLINKLNENEYKIKWSIKDHDLSIQENLQNINVDNNENILSGKFEKLIDIAELMNNTVLKDKLVYCGDVLYYIEDNVLITKERIIKQAVIKKLKEQDFYIPCYDKYMPIISDYKNMEEIFKWILLDVEKNNNMIDEIWENTLRKLCFDNGYYDFNKNKFVEYEPTFKTAIKLSNKLNMKSNPTIRKELIKRVLYPIFTVKNEDDDQFHLMEYMLHRLARIMAGHIEDKVWMTFEGLRDSGKGVLCDLFKNCFGKYVQTINASCFLMKQGDEDAKTLSWLLDLQFARLALTQEIQIGDDKKAKTILDGNKIKKMNSGGDRLSSRKNYQDEVEFRIQCSLVMCINDLPEIKPSDAKQKCIPFIMKSVFVTDIKKDEYSNFNYYLQDGEIKNFIKEEEVINEFILLLLDYYNRKDTKYPAKLYERNQAVDEDEDDEKRLINSFIINETTIGNKLSNNDIKQILTDEDIRMTLKKAKMLLCGKGASEYKSGASRGLKDIMLNEPTDDNE